MAVHATAISLPKRLQPTDISLAAGQLTCIVGPNGAGKTSFLQAIGGVGRPSGQVRIDDLNPALLNPDQRKALLAYLPASRDVAWPVAARDLITLGLPTGAVLGTVVAELDLGPLLDRRVDRLSTGERSRVLIARALAPEPQLLLLDEPLANLDPYWQLRLMDLLRERSRHRGCAVLAALHDLDVAAAYADRLLVVHEGRIVGDDVPGEILANELVRTVFRIAKGPRGWYPLRPAADPRSSP